MPFINALIGADAVTCITLQTIVSSWRTRGLRARSGAALRATPVGGLVLPKLVCDALYRASPDAERLSYLKAQLDHQRSRLIVL